MDLLLNIVLYIVITFFLIIFFRKAIELFSLGLHKFSKKYKKDKGEEK